MCLIIYSKNGKLPPKEDFHEAAKDNPDGIGVMSSDGVDKFLGKRATKRAWRYVSDLAKAGIPFGVHFRWATHGKVGRENSHPFQAPGTGDYVMHNGILWTSKMATDDESDTAIFVRNFLPHFGHRSDSNWKASVLQSIGYGNKLLVMADDGASFTIVNESAGDWLEPGEIWLSNTYSVVSTNAFSRSYYSGKWDNEDFDYKWEKPGTAVTIMGSRDDYEAEMDDDAEPTVSDADWFRYQRALEKTYIHNATGRSLESAVKNRAFKRGTGFDWHDSSTWSKYPIPGTEGRALNRHGSNETEPDADDMDGVQEFV